jgi:hypothetical protein
MNKNCFKAKTEGDNKDRKIFGMPQLNSYILFAEEID